MLYNHSLALGSDQSLLSVYGVASFDFDSDFPCTAVFRAWPEGQGAIHEGGSEYKNYDSCHDAARCVQCQGPFSLRLCPSLATRSCSSNCAALFGADAGVC